MLGGIAQAEVNDQIKDLDESSSQKLTNGWKALSPVGSFTSNNPIYQVYGQQKNNENSSQKPKKNQNQNQNSNKQVNHHQQQNKFPLVGTLVNFNKIKNSQQNKQRNNNNNPIKSAINVNDYSNWNQINKKQRTEPQTSSSNQNVFVIRPMLRNKHARDDRKATITRLKEPARDMRPPPPLKAKQAPHLLLGRIK